MEIALDKSERAAASGATLSVQIRKQREHFALQVDCAFPPGISILFGASGAGKTTLLDCIAGLARPDAGRIAIADRELFANGEAVPVEHRKIGYVFQDLALFPHLTVEANVQYGLGHLPKPERQQKCDRMLESFRISHLKARRPNEISGGERQRVALARSLVTDPRALLLDEPLAALDAATKSRIIDDLRAWNQAHRIPIVYVTHSRDEVFALGERVLVMEQGRIVASGTPHEVMSAPRQETVAQLSGFENIFDAEVTSIHEERGTMICRLADSAVELETPLVRATVGQSLLVGIQAGDILLATSQPVGLSARNLLPGKIVSLVQRDVIIVATAECGVAMAVHLTLAARDALHLQPGCAVWLVIKTHSCHLMAR
jgi:molybdate transport system ATP-binding protein